MGSFVEDLWASVFTPGPTPTLLVAANVTFATLQTLLLVLLLATYSIHFVALSVLSGGLWWSVNWFAKELRQAQAQTSEMDAQLQKVSRNDKETTDNARKTRATPDAAESDTETESLAERKSTNAPGSAPRSLTASATLQPPSTGEVRKRVSIGGESSGYTSTDSEWEKVDDSAN